MIHVNYECLRKCRAPLERSSDVMFLPLELVK